MTDVGCARPRTSAPPPHLRQLLSKIRRSIPPGTSVRLLLAGFELPAAAPARLRAGYLFAASRDVPGTWAPHVNDKFREFGESGDKGEGGNGEGVEAESGDGGGGGGGGSGSKDEFGQLGVAQLYGGALGGPSVVLEYEVEAEAVGGGGDEGGREDEDEGEGEG